MGISKDILGVKGDECNCGRRATIRHCPTCGSTRLYTRQNRYHKMLSGELKFVQNQTRCQSCGHEFIEEEREFCEAPAVGQELAKRKVQVLAQARAQGEFLRPEDAKIADLIAQAIAQAKVEPQAPIEESSTEQVNSEGPLTEPGSPSFDVRWELRKEWSLMKMNGQAPTETSEEYVERRLKGELFNV